MSNAILTTISFGMPQSLFRMRMALLLSFVFCLLRPVNSTLWIGNSTYASLPGLFGETMIEGKIYRARLQFLPENPYLCDDIDLKNTSFVLPSSSRNKNHKHTKKRKGETEADEVVDYSMVSQIRKGIGTPPPLPQSVSQVDTVALIAARGSCPFQRKAEVAEAVSDRVQFLIVYNYNLEGEDTVVPMYSQQGDTRLRLLSITHRSGAQILHHLGAPHRHSQRQQNDRNTTTTTTTTTRPGTAAMNNKYKSLGGPIVYMDSTPPEGLLTMKDLQHMIMSALGVFFMLVSFSGCMIIVAGSYGYSDWSLEDGRLVLRVPSSSEESSSKRLMTEDQVHEIAKRQRKNAVLERGGEENTSKSTYATDTTCAICIEDLPPVGEDDSTITLPCQHRFHTDCVVPWLTERQSKCPMCKFDLMQHLGEQNGHKKDDSTATVESSSSSLSLPSAIEEMNANHNSRSAPVAATVAATDWLAQRIQSLRRRGRWTRVQNLEEEDEQNPTVWSTTFSIGATRGLSPSAAATVDRQSYGNNNGIELMANSRIDDGNSII